MFKRALKNDHDLQPLWTPFWGRFWEPKSTQSRSRIGLKSEQARKAKMFKKKQLVFKCFCASAGSKINQKLIKNRLQEYLKRREQKSTPKMLQKCSNMAPKSTQVGAMLASKTVLDPPNSAQEATHKTTPKNINLWMHGTGSAFVLGLW